MDKIELQKYSGGQMKKYRIAAGLSKDTMAQQLNIQKRIFSKYENGLLSPKQDTIFEIAYILKISIDILFPSVD